MKINGLNLYSNVTVQQIGRKQPIELEYFIEDECLVRNIVDSGVNIDCFNDLSSNNTTNNSEINGTSNIIKTDDTLNSSTTKDANPESKGKPPDDANGRSVSRLNGERFF